VLLFKKGLRIFGKWYLKKTTKPKEMSTILGKVYHAHPQNQERIFAAKHQEYRRCKNLPSLSRKNQLSMAMRALSGCPTYRLCAIKDVVYLSA